MIERSRRLLFLAPAAGGGGAEAALGDLLAAVHSARPEWELRVLALEDGPLLEQTRARLGPGAAGVLPGAAGVRAVGRASGWAAKVGSGWAVVRAAWALREELRRTAPDLVHSNGLKMHALSGLVGTFPPPGGKPHPPLVWQLHDYPGGGRRTVGVLRALSKPCSLALAVSESVADDARATFEARLTVRTVHNAIDLERFTPDGPSLDLDALSALPPAAPGTVRVGLVATFARWKGHVTFLQAAAAVLRGKGTGAVRFYVIGGPIYATAGSQYSIEELRAAARAAGLRETDVGFTGFVADAPAAMRALDVVVHASTQPEPFGLVLAQAMACGRALVTSGLGGAAEVARPGVDALVHQAGNADSLAAAVLRLTADAGLRVRLGTAGTAGAKRFSRERLAEAIVPVYEGLMGTTVKRGPLQVFHLGAGNLFGGVERVLLTLARSRELTPGMEPQFGLAFGDGPIAGQLRAAGVPVEVYGPVRVSRPWTVLQGQLGLGESLALWSPDIVVCHAPWTLAITASTVRAAGIPLVFWMHDAANGRHWTQRWAGWHPPDAVIANSRWTAGGLPALFGPRRAEALPVTVLPYPIVPPPPADPAGREATRAEIGAAPGEVVIVQISRMEPWKGQRTHLKALGRLRDVPGWTCWMVGGAQRPAETAYFGELKSLAATLGVADRVRFLGQRGDVERLLAAADIFCQPNDQPEPFGIVFVEALYAGLPVVSSAAGGALEIVDETCGRLVPPGDETTLAETLRDLITDPSRRRELAAGGPAKARALCDPAAVLGQLETRLRSMVPRFSKQG